MLIYFNFCCSLSWLVVFVQRLEFVLTPFSVSLIYFIIIIVQDINIRSLISTFSDEPCAGPYLAFIIKSLIFSQSIVVLKRTLVQTQLPGVSEKKYGVADYQYLENDITQLCDISRLSKYNL